MSDPTVLARVPRKHWYRTVLYKANVMSYSSSISRAVRVQVAALCRAVYLTRFLPIRRSCRFALGRWTRRAVVEVVKVEPQPSLVPLPSGDPARKARGLGSCTLRPIKDGDSMPVAFSRPRVHSVEAFE